MIKKLGSYVADVGSLKVGAKGISFLISNGIGDGRFDVYLCSVIGLPKDLEYVMSFQGENMSIFDYDCGDSTMEDVSLTGSFLAYRYKGDIYLEKIASTNNWGANI